MKKNNLLSLLLCCSTLTGFAQVQADSTDRDVTASVSVIGQPQLENRVITNVSKIFDGLVPGVISTLGSGQPGSGADILIRGFSGGLPGSEPVYVVDGLIYKGSLSGINMNDIESIEVLKDASACALYGVYGTNGVIRITTKSGANQSGPLSITFKGRWGVASNAIPFYQTMDERDFLETIFGAYKNDAIYDRGMTPENAGLHALELLEDSGGVLGDNERYNPFNYPIRQLIDPLTGKIRPDAGLKYHEDWMEEVSNNAPLRQDYYVSAAGRSDKADIMAAVGYLKEEGMIKTTGFERYTGRLNANVYPFDWVKAGITAAYSKDVSDFIPDTDMWWWRTRRKLPVYPVYQHDPVSGALLLDDRGNKQYDAGTLISGYNAVQTLYSGSHQQTSTDFSGRAYVHLTTCNEKYGAWQGFYFTLAGGMKNATVDILNDLLKTFSDNPWNYFSEKSKAKAKAYTFNQLLGYTRAFGHHQLDVALEHEYRGEDEDDVVDYVWYNEYLPSYFYGDLQRSGKLNTFSGRLDYNFSRKYYLSTAIRRDIYNNNDGFSSTFWSLGLAWNVKNEAFLSPVSWINDMQLKASYGEHGSDREFVKEKSLYVGDPSDMTTVLFPDFSAGLTAKLFDRLFFQVEYYKRKSMNTQVVSSGGSTPDWYYPVASTNQGIELAVAVDVLRMSSFAWRLTAMGQTLNNQVDWIYDHYNPTLSYDHYIVEKEKPLATFYLRKYLGVNPQDGSSEIGAEREASGSRLPDFFGSFTNDFVFLGNLSLSVQCNYSIGGKVFDAVYADLMPDGFFEGNLHVDMLQSWKRPGDQTEIPRFSGDLYIPVSDRFLTDASYFSIKHISLAYDFPKAWIEKVKISSLRLLLVVENAAMFSARKGLNPQYDFAGNTGYGYPPARTVSIGIDLSL